MIELKFDTEGITSCPMNETATIEECMQCRYWEFYDIEGTDWAIDTCSYEDKFPGLKDFAGLEDCIYIRGRE